MTCTMPRPKRHDLAMADETSTPPDALPLNHALARIDRNDGKNVFVVSLPSGETMAAELAPRFRSTLWIRRGAYVVVNRSALAERDNKLGGEIVNVVVDEKEWRKKSYWFGRFLDEGISID